MSEVSIVAAAKKQNDALFIEPDEKSLAAIPVNRARKRAVRTRAPRSGPVVVAVHELEKCHPAAKELAMQLAGNDRSRIKVISDTEVVVVNHPER
jgi:hypothetical protein